MNVPFFKRNVLPHIIAIVTFFIVSSVYFYPAWQGKTIQKHDSIAGKGKVREKLQYREFEKQEVLWNNSIFSGMPEYVYATYGNSKTFSSIYSIPQKLGIPREVAVFFWFMFGFYILFMCMKVNPWLSIAGSISFALTTYNLAIIDAGHFTKVYTLSLIPPTIGGILLAFRRKYLLSFAVTGLFLAMQINMGHFQMTYYSLIVVIIIGMVEFFYHLKNKEIIPFFKSVGVLFLAAFLALSTNYSKLINVYKYNKQSIRGKSELTIGDKNQKTKSGLDRDYINAWSSGVDESMMLFVPNVKGGTSGAIKNNKSLYGKIDRRDKQFLGNWNQYWGNQPFNGTPNYIGALLFFLFFIGLFLVKDRIKVAVLISSILLLFLSWGGNFSTFTDLFIDYVPLYNKFRAPVSIMAVLAILTTFFAFYTLFKIVKEPEIVSQSTKFSFIKNPVPKYIWVSMIFILFLLLNMIFPELFNSYISDSEYQQLGARMNESQIKNMVDKVVAFRISMFRADLLRTLVFTILGFAAIYLYANKKIKSGILFGVIAVLSIVDLWAVDNRYVNADSFSKISKTSQEYRLTDIDKQIYRKEMSLNPSISRKLEENSSKYPAKNDIEKENILTFTVNNEAHYRVFDLTRSPFNDNNASFAHRSIGGYIAYKLRRYQDMIEHHISKNNMQVLNMLNTKYFITKQGLQQNSNALGVAWFVDSIYWAKNPNDEILSLNKINTKNTATLQLKEKDDFSSFSRAEPTDKIELTSFNPDKMVYKTKTGGDRLAVFSEVYYPDWEVKIDGEKKDIYVADYILRSVVVPKGEHVIEFILHPKQYYQGNTISQLFLYALLLAVVAIFSFGIYGAFKAEKAVLEDKNK